MTSNTNGYASDPRLTPMEAWRNDYDAVTLPSGKVIGMRHVNVIALMNAQGKIPAFVRANIEYGSGLRKERPQASADDTAELDQLGDSILRAGLVFPPLAATEEEEREGKGVQLIRFSQEDKIFLLTRAAGGAPAIAAAQTFPEPATADLQPVSAIEGVREEPGDDARNL